MKKFKFFSKRFTTSFSGFSKKGLGLMVVLVGVMLLSIVSISPFVTKGAAAIDWGQESTPCNVDSVPIVGCRCNYDGLTADTPPQKIHITCDRDKKLICSNNIKAPVDVSVCLKRIGSLCTSADAAVSGGAAPNGGDAVCEAGAICNMQTGVCEIDTGNEYLEGALGSQVSDIRDTIRRFINIGLGFLGVLTVIFIIYGGILWLTAAGNEDKVSKGKQTLMWAAIGAIVISIAWTISSYVLQIGKTVG